MRIAALVALALAAIVMLAPHARAADAENGRRLAQSHCAFCHAVTPRPPGEVAVAPPFELIGRKYGFDPEAVARAILAPHPKMNFVPGPADAADIAAYISMLPR
jgi:mono/diheme cytochrome c family protein